jgi:predicted site-specific integrase-resolvase
MFVKCKIACDFYGVTPQTLLKWANNETIKSITSVKGSKRYWIDDDKSTHNQDKETKGIFGYARVSSPKQKDDLQRQINFILEKYPKAKILSEVGSSLTWGRPVFIRLMDKIILGKVDTLIITHKDRLSRFNFEPINWLCKRHNVSIIILGDEKHPNDDLSPEAELIEDMLAITHSFSCKLYGRRRHKHKMDNTTELTVNILE